MGSFSRSGLVIFMESGKSLLKEIDLSVFRLLTTPIELEVWRRRVGNLDLLSKRCDLQFFS